MAFIEIGIILITIGLLIFLTARRSLSLWEIEKTARKADDELDRLLRDHNRRREEERK